MRFLRNQEPEPVGAAPDSPGRDDAGQAHFLSVPMLLAVAGLVPPLGQEKSAPQRLHPSQ